MAGCLVAGWLSSWAGFLAWLGWSAGWVCCLAGCAGILVVRQAAWWLGRLPGGCAGLVSKLVAGLDWAGLVWWLGRLPGG